MELKLFTNVYYVDKPPADSVYDLYEENTRDLNGILGRLTERMEVQKIHSVEVNSVAKFLAAIDL